MSKKAYQLFSVIVMLLCLYACGAERDMKKGEKFLAIGEYYDAAETGKNIAADYICQARVGSFGTSLTLSAELYETAGNKLIASFNGRGQNVEELLD